VKEEAGGERWRLAAALIPWIAGITTAAVSWQRWVMPFVDGSREMSVPARVASGERLYRDVVYYYGPVGPWLGAAFMRVFGLRWTSIEILCAVLSIVLFVSMFRCLERLGSLRAAVVAVTAAVAICVGAPNGGAFLYPYSVDSLAAVAFSLAAIALASGESGSSRTILAAAALGIAIGARVEVGVPLALALLFAGLRWRDRPGDPDSAHVDRRIAVSGLFLGAGIWIVALAGIPVRALSPEGPGAVLSPPAEWRRVYEFISGLDHPLAGLTRVATGTFLLGTVLAICWLLRRRTQYWIALVALAVGTLFSSWGRVADAQWPSLFSVVPIASIALAGVLIWRPWSPRVESELPLLVLAATLGSRVLLRLTYGQETTPYSILALPCLLAVAAIALIDRAPTLSRRPAEGFRKNVSWLFAGVAAAGFIRTVHLSAPSRTVAVRTPVGELRLPPRQAGPVRMALEYLERASVPGDGLVALPEAGFFNTALRLRNPLREEQILPGHLNASSEREVVDRLLATRPRFVVLVGQPSRAFGRVAFGEDYARGLWAAIRSRYVPRVVFGSDRPDPRIGESAFFVEILELTAAR
jgi:hypothetical protein